MRTCLEPSSGNHFSVGSYLFGSERADGMLLSKLDFLITVEFLAILSLLSGDGNAIDGISLIILALTVFPAIVILFLSIWLNKKNYLRLNITPIAIGMQLIIRDYFVIESRKTGIG